MCVEVELGGEAHEESEIERDQRSDREEPHELHPGQRRSFQGEVESVHHQPEAAADGGGHRQSQAPKACVRRTEHAVCAHHASNRAALPVRSQHRDRQREHREPERALDHRRHQLGATFHRELPFGRARHLPTAEQPHGHLERVEQQQRRHHRRAQPRENPCLPNGRHPPSLESIHTPRHTHSAF